MLRKTTAAVVLAGALALGTASATSLGTFDDVSFAASDVGLQDCTIVADTLDLVPAIPTADTAVTDLSETFELATLDLSMLDPAALPADCTGTLAEVLLIGDSATDGLGVADADGADEVLESISVDLVNDTLTAVPVTGTFDVKYVTEVRLVVRNNA